MLSTAIKFKNVFPRFAAKDPHYDDCPCLEDWEKVEKLYSSKRVEREISFVRTALHELYSEYALLYNDEGESFDKYKGAVLKVKKSEPNMYLEESYYSFKKDNNRTPIMQIRTCVSMIVGSRLLRGLLGLGRALADVFEVVPHFTKPMDRCFIRELVRKVEFGCIENGQPNVVVVPAAVSAVYIVFGTRLCVNVGHSRLNHLRERYDTFTWLINRPGVRWIPRPKLEKLFARAYRWDTEPAWEELKIVFGQPHQESIHRSDDELYPAPENNPEEIVVRVPFDHNGSS
ncbi:hypothetical protein Salat_2562400 [Sesamum alatum]|uniref:Uncharacterized protein n=1 Tax=Sesamum alatum TaxID=300844 RepID=A0AAE1XSQ2_9LAMI|nr:hypothetical protein Salat_2562400 [Sesamum alatum]